MRRYDALARHARAQHADSQIKVFNLGIVSGITTAARDVTILAPLFCFLPAFSGSQLVQIELDELEGGDIQSVGNVK